MRREAFGARLGGVLGAPLGQGGKYPSCCMPLLLGLFACVPGLSMTPCLPARAIFRGQVRCGTVSGVAGGPSSPARRLQPAHPPCGPPSPRLGVHTLGQLTGAAASVTSPVLSNYVAWPWGAALLPCQMSLVMRPLQKDLV